MIAIYFFLAQTLLLNACRVQQFRIVSAADDTTAIEENAINIFLGTHLIAAFVFYTNFSTNIDVLPIQNSFCSSIIQLS